MIKSEIGFIVYLLFRDKYSRNPSHSLIAKERMRLQKNLSTLINSPADKCDLEFCNAENSNVSFPPRYEDEYKFNL